MPNSNHRALLAALVIGATSLFAFTLLTSPQVRAQRHVAHTVKARVTPNATGRLTADSIPDLYSVSSLGSTVLDSATPFPVPIAFLDLRDSNRYRLSVRFPHLGALGVEEDTVATPTFVAANGASAFRAKHAIMQYKFPDFGYAFWIDVFERNTDRLITSRLMPYSMNMERYADAKYEAIHEPTNGLGSQLLRRAFRPNLLPLDLETNPGWRGIETMNSRGVYSLRFVDPKDSTKTFLSISINPVAFRTLDSMQWEEFKDRARVAFGTKGVAVSSIGDFEVQQPAARGIMEHGYEFLSKSPDDALDYVATYMTPHAIILMMAPIERSVPADKFEFYRAIARSFRLKAELMQAVQARASR